LPRSDTKSDAFLRIGYAEARPWCYRTRRGLSGHDVAAACDIAALLGVDPVFIACRPSALRVGLLLRRFDVAIGGLIDMRLADIACIRVRHVVQERANSTEPARVRYRRVFFPNVWWIRAGEARWHSRLWTLLLLRRWWPLRWRTRMRAA
jgi:hypothetical protein